MEHPLLDLLLNGAAFSEIIDKAEQVLGNPVAFIDTAQNETTLSAHYPREDMEDKAYRRQQISDEEYQKNTDYKYCNQTPISSCKSNHIISPKCRNEN